MRNLLTSGLAVFAGMVSVPTGVSPHQTQRAPVTPSYQQDPRLKQLEKFFGKAGCPVIKYSGTFLEAADAYDLDWRLLPSISFIESTGGKAARNNNFFGWDSGRVAFDSPIAAIHTVGYRLAHSRLYRDKDLDGILATYNPDTEYAGKVKAVMRQISPSE